MQDGITPEELHSKAFARYTQGENGDDRSVLYAQADERVANRSEPVRRVGTKWPANWATALHEYEGFWREHGRRPREHTRNRATLPAEESGMGCWARYQSRFEGKLCQYQRIRLDISPAFEWDIHEGDWQKALDACIGHFQKAGRRPYLNRSDRTEFALARWLNRQLLHLKNDTLSKNRAERISTILTSWNDSAQ